MGWRWRCALHGAARFLVEEAHGFRAAWRGGSLVERRAASTRLLPDVGEAETLNLLCFVFYSGSTEVQRRRENEGDKQ